MNILIVLFAIFADLLHALHLIVTSVHYTDCCWPHDQSSDKKFIDYNISMSHLYLQVYGRFCPIDVSPFWTLHSRTFHRVWTDGLLSIFAVHLRLSWGETSWERNVEGTKCPVYLFNSTVEGYFEIL